MADIWLTSDTHYGHHNILKYCKRPFNDIAHMNEALIANFNSVVKTTDVVYHLGDFAMMREPDHILRRLHGQKHLILGNHDKRIGMRNSTYLSSVRDVYELHVGGTSIWLSHYAHARWPKAHHGALHCFGHSHGSFVGLGRSMDVGVDPMGYFPIHVDEVIKRLAKLAPVEHHGED